MSKGTVLVTGGSGYIGSVLVPLLLRSDWKVRVIDVGYFGHEGLSAVKNDIELIEGDIRSAPKSLFEGVSAVIHLAGFSNDPTAEYNPMQNFSVNFEGTRHLAELAREAGVPRFIFASSCSVYYSEQPDDTICTEEKIIYPKAPYSLSKHLAEQFLLGQRSDTFAPVMLRKGTVFGSSPRMRYDLAINTFLKNAYINKTLILHSGGWMWRPFLDIEDAARAYLFALEAPIGKVSGGIFNVIGFNKLVKDIAEDIVHIVKDSFDIDLIIKAEKTGPQRSYRVSGEKFEKIGFHPQSDFTQAAKSIWEVLASGKHDLGESKYYNIRQFEYLFPREF
ncbi:MAG: SDR family oxidoreductase [Patescibacteria group bacterium]